MLIATRKENRWIALAFWAKKDLDNIKSNELREYRSLATGLLDMPDSVMQQLLISGQMEEIYTTSPSLAE